MDDFPRASRDRLGGLAGHAGARLAVAPQQILERDAVQELVVKNADIIKIWVDDRNGTVKKLTPALYRAVIDEAHKNNKQVIAHLFTLADAKDLVKSGIDAFAHLVRDKEVDAELLKMIKDRPNFYVIPNLPPNPDAATD